MRGSGIKRSLYEDGTAAGRTKLKDQAFWDIAARRQFRPKLQRLARQNVRKRLQACNRLGGCARLVHSVA